MGLRDGRSVALGQAREDTEKAKVDAAADDVRDQAKGDAWPRQDLGMIQEPVDRRATDEQNRPMVMTATRNAPRLSILPYP